MTEIERRFADAVTAIARVLKAHGFRKKRLVWTKVGDGFVHEIVVQRSQGNSAEGVRFYVNAAVYVADFDQTIGKEIPDYLALATPQHRVRFEEITDWPDGWVDVVRDDDVLESALPAALEQVVARLDEVTDAESVAQALLRSGHLLDFGLFAWFCASGRVDDARAQRESAFERFGDEERWPRLAALFEEVAIGYGVQLL